MSVTDNDFNIDEIIAGVKQISGSSVRVGPSVRDKNQNILIIAGANEYGATITSKKAIAKLWYMLVESGMLNASDLPLIVWMKVKKEIRIPARSYIESTRNDPDTRAYVVQQVQFALNNFLNRKASAVSVIETAGNAVILKIRRRLTSNIMPKNHPLTVERKGSGKNTLNDTGVLQNSLQMEVLGA